MWLNYGIINSLKPNGNYTYQLLTISNAAFCVNGSVLLSLLVVIISLYSINQLIFVMVKCGVLFEVRAGFLNYLGELRLQRVNMQLLLAFYIDWRILSKVVIMSSFSP
jgi:hypothetical protein